MSEKEGLECHPQERAFPWFSCLPGGSFIPSSGSPRGRVPTAWLPHQVRRFAQDGNMAKAEAERGRGRPNGDGTDGGGPQAQVWEVFGSTGFFLVLFDDLVEVGNE